MTLLKRSTLVLILLTTTSKIFSQSYDAQRSQVFVTNIVSNALIGGIGGAINRDKGEKIYKAFIRNFLKGGVGGLVKYTAKYETFYLAYADLPGYSPNGMNNFYAPVNRLWFFLGHSIVMNAAYNKKVTDGYYCNFYGIDLKFRPKSEQKLQVRLSLASLEGAVEYGIRGFQFNLYKTLEFGVLIFDDTKGSLGKFDGQARFNTVVQKKSQYSSEPWLLPHELIHTYQMYDFCGINAFYDKKTRPLYENKKIYKALSNYIVLDQEMLYMLALYTPQYHKPPHYYKNYFEFEAEHFASRMPVVR